jgi:hypothetical protein
LEPVVNNMRTIIHEFGHHYASKHLSEAYNDALSRLAAKTMALRREGKLP